MLRNIHIKLQSDQQNCNITISTADGSNGSEVPMIVYQITIATVYREIFKDGE